MPIEVARRVDDQLLEKLKEFESTLQVVHNKVAAGGIRSDYVNVHGNNLLFQLNKQGEESEYMQGILLFYGKLNTRYSHSNFSLPTLVTSTILLSLTSSFFVQ
jgi:hypothetical protein